MEKKKKSNAVSKHKQGKNLTLKLGKEFYEKMLI